MKPQTSSFLILGLCSIISCALTSKSDLQDQSKAVKIVTVEKIPVEVRAEQEKKFIAANNQPLWLSSKVYADEFSGDVTSAAVSMKHRSKGAKTTAKRQEQAAREFIVKNRGFLGLDGVDVSKQCRFEVSRRIKQRVNVTCAKMSYPGVETLKNGTYEPKFIVMVDSDRVVQMTNRSKRLPSFTNLVVSPSIAKDDKALTAKIVGKEMSFANFAGKEVSAGKVKKEHLSEPELGIFSHRASSDKLTIRLAWFIKCTLGDLSWQFVVDAHSGQIVRVQQNFFT